MSVSALILRVYSREKTAVPVLEPTDYPPDRQI